MKTTSKKRGFTIVELVIVIAVIAILAAVLIPTFTGVIRRANESKDVQLVRNLNTILAADKATNAHETVDEALAVVAESGFDVGKINASANQNMILWDSVNDVFCYLDDGELVYDTEPETATADIDLWAISSKVNSTYSTYLTAAYNGNVIHSIVFLSMRCFKVSSKEHRARCKCRPLQSALGVCPILQYRFLSAPRCGRHCEWWSSDAQW